MTRNRGGMATSRPKNSTSKKRTAIGGIAPCLEPSDPPPLSPAEKQAHPAYWPTFGAALNAILVKRVDLGTGPGTTLRIDEDAKESRDAAYRAASIIADEAVECLAWIERQDT